MQLGLKKCATAPVENGELVNGGIISLPDNRVIKPASETAPYKYLGVLQVLQVKNDDSQKSVVSSYVKRVHKVVWAKFQA